MKFNELNLSADLLAEIEKAGFVEASPIQEQTIPLALEGKDVIGQAQTGTGKTAAFGLPTLEKIRTCLLYTSPSPRDATLSRMPSSA